MTYIYIFTTLQNDNVNTFSFSLSLSLSLCVCVCTQMHNLIRCRKITLIYLTSPIIHLYVSVMEGLQDLYVSLMEGLQANLYVSLMEGLQASWLIMGDLDRSWWETRLEYEIERGNCKTASSRGSSDTP